MYRPGNTNIEKTGLSTVVKQQWLLLQKNDRTYVHLYDTAIVDILLVVKKSQKNNSEIIITMDGNEQNCVNLVNYMAHLLTVMTNPLTQVPTSEEQNKYM